MPMQPTLRHLLPTRRRKSRRLRRRGGLAGSFALLLVPILTASVAYAAFSVATQNTGNRITAGTVALSDNDVGVALLGLTNAALGASDTSCMKTTFDGTLSSQVRNFATVTGTAAPYLSLEVTRGTGANTFDSCTGFAADANDYIGAGNGVLYDGKLSNYPTTSATGIVDPAVGGTGSYATTVAADANLTNHWRLGDTDGSSEVITVWDTLTDTLTGRTLQAHTTGETGATWTKKVGSDMVITDVDRLRRNGTTLSVYTASGIAASADYTVEADLTYKSSIANDWLGVIARVDLGPTNASYYAARYEQGDQSWNIVEVTDGNSDWLDFDDNWPLTIGQTYHIEFVLSGSTLELYVDDVLVANDVDSTLSSGRTGVNGDGDSTPTDATGMHLDNIKTSKVTPDTTANDSEGTNDGTYTNSPTRQVAGAPTGDADKAVTFDGVNDYVTAPRQISDDFTIECWFKSTQGISTASTWTSGAGLVDATAAGTVNDFGLSLRSDGKVMAGVGNADTTIVSTSGDYNDGNWHHVAFTRKRSNGAMKLYVDGVLAGTATGNTNALTAAANINIGRIQTGSNYYAGQIDEVALYNTDLSAATITAHYNSLLTPETWTTGESHVYKFKVSVDNNVAAYGLSSDATFTWHAANL